MCSPFILSSVGNIFSFAGMFNPPSIAPFNAAKSFDPFSGVVNPKSSIAFVIFLSLAFFAK
jgi:hypothetical protein